MPRRSPLSAVLLSLLVFPGAGQAWLGRYRRALGFALPAALALLPVLLDAWRTAQVLVQHILSGTLASDTDVVAAALAGVSEESAASGWLLWVFLACWVASAWDAYVLAKKM